MARPATAVNVASDRPFDVGTWMTWSGWDFTSESEPESDVPASCLSE